MARRVVALVPLLVTVFGSVAGAQTRPLVIVEDTETYEFGGHFGTMSFVTGTPLWGAQVTRNVTSWIAGEVGVHVAPDIGEIPHGSVGTVTASLRIGARVPIVFDGEPVRVRVFGTAGAARGFGLSYRYTPVLGFGVQGQPPSRLPLAWRVDVQRLTSGRPLDGGVRITFGIVILT